MPVLKVTGVAELRRALQAMSKDAAKEFTQANKTIGQVVVAEAIRRAPKGPHEGGGQVTSLSSSIGMSIGGRTTKAGETFSVRVTAGGPSTPYAAPTEFGGYIARRGFSGINRRGKQQAHLQGHRGILTHIKRQPYLMPAIAAKLDQVVALYGAAIDRLIAKFGV